MATSDRTTGSRTGVPELKGEARRAVFHRGSHVQIIASAGSGKTEVVSQRIVELFAERVPPEAVVAFTFTERAAESLKSRVERRIGPKLGPAFIDQLNGFFCGTIHSYCFRLLQLHVPRYETYDVLDDHRLAAFLAREDSRFSLRSLEKTQWKSIHAFITNVQVVENELLEVDQLEDPFREVYERYLSSLESYRLLTYGQIISRAVTELRDPAVFAKVHGPLRHLIVDEYQDVNPAQEALIELLTQPGVELCVVGDDDQSIYQWRGSTVQNIVTFPDRYKLVASFTIEENRRSRPGIVDAANGFGDTIDGRLPKTMQAVRDGSGDEVVCWSAPTEAEQADRIAHAIRRAVDERGYRYRDIAVLVRGKTSYPSLLRAFVEHGIPVAPAGRTLLFATAEAQLLGETLAWLVDHDWRSQSYGWGTQPEIDQLIDRYKELFGLTTKRARTVRAYLEAWKAEIDAATKRADLVGNYYELLAALGATEWDLNDPTVISRVGSLARFSQLLADYEAVRRRSRPDFNRAGSVIGGQDRGSWYHKNLAIYVQNWALGAYEDFEGEDDLDIDAVDLTTVHQSKGLEWPIVFVPSLSSRRFPSSYTGRRQEWKIDRSLFDRARYEGTENDERRLFYVAMTRARDQLSLSTFRNTEKQAASASTFLEDVAGDMPTNLKVLPPPPAAEAAAADDAVPSVVFSDAALMADCPMAYRFRRLFGFQPSLATELGYGKAVHHVLRRVAEHVIERGQLPTTREVDRLFDRDFYLPAANKAAHDELKTAARRLIDNYMAKYGDDLYRVWAVERPFELHLGDATITGRADVILELDESGDVKNLAIVDYKTSAEGEGEHDLQLQVYTDGGRREGLAVRAAYVHDLRAGDRIEVAVDEGTVGQAEEMMRDIVSRIRNRRLTATPGDICGRCDVRKICKYAVKSI